MASLMAICPRCRQIKKDLGQCSKCSANVISLECTDIYWGKLPEEQKQERISHILAGTDFTAESRISIDHLIITTTASIEGRSITAYKGVVFGEVITGINFLKDISASFRDVFGGRSAGYESEMAKARQDALYEMGVNAVKLGADAVVGVSFDYESMGSSNGMIMVTVSGTAVVTNPM